MHIVNKSPFENNALGACLKHLAAGAAVLLIEDGVYAATSDCSDIATVAEQGASIYALGPDLAARGFSEKNIIKPVQVVSYEGFVDLVVEHDNVQTW